MKTLDWYFDFISPFSYLQIESFDRLPKGVEVIGKPVLFAGLLDHWQHKGPAEIPQKRRFTYRHVQWLAARHAIPLKFPPAHPFNPIRALRLAIALDCRLDAIQKIFRFIWREGRSLDDRAEWNALIETLEVQDVEQKISAPAVKEALRKNGQTAITLGVFGVPTFAVDGELFWGFDATDMLLDYLRDPALFSTDEIARVSDLPAAVQR